MSTNADELAVTTLRIIDSSSEKVSEESHIWQVELFNENGKWKYTAYLYMEKPESWMDHRELINMGMYQTPASVRGVTFDKMPDKWIAIMVNNPLGYPIMAIG